MAGVWVMPAPWAPQGERVGPDLLAAMDPQHAEESWLRAMPTCCSHTGRGTGTICCCTAGLELAETLSYTIMWILDYIIYLIPFWKHFHSHAVWRLILFLSYLLRYLGVDGYAISDFSSIQSCASALQTGKMSLCMNVIIISENNSKCRACGWTTP